MQRTPLSIPEIAIISGTRAALGAGVALLLSGRISAEQRRAIGWTLVGVGAITTIPILAQVLSSRRGEHTGAPGSDSRSRRLVEEECCP